LKLKGEFESTVEAIGFEHMVFLRPFFITGKKERKRGRDGAVQAGVRVMRAVSAGLLTGWRIWRERRAGRVDGADGGRGARGFGSEGTEIGELASQA
jgi:hypothetical protein